MRHKKEHEQHPPEAPNSPSDDPGEVQQHQNRQVGPKDRLITLNDWLQARKALVETIGIMGGIALLVFTAWYTYITQSSLGLAQQQFLQQQMPVWDFVVNNESETIQIRPASSGVRLETADVSYPEAVKSVMSYMAISWPVDPPDHEWHVTMLRSFLRQFFEGHFPYEEGFATVATRGGFPVCITVTYTHFGESRSVRGLFVVQYMVVRTERTNTKVDFSDVHFVRYLPITVDMQAELAKEWHEMRLDEPPKTKRLKP